MSGTRVSINTVYTVLDITQILAGNIKILDLSKFSVGMWIEFGSEESLLAGLHERSSVLRSY